MLSDVCFVFLPLCPKSHPCRNESHACPSFSDSLIFDAVCALVVHGVYDRLEAGPANLAETFLLLIGIPAVPRYFLADHIESMPFSIVIAYGLFYAVLIPSIVLYRISPLHPLAKYPGPLLLKASKLVGMCFALGGKQHVYFKSLHDKYGPFVRIGPNELLIADVEAIPSILGLDGMRKGPLWTASARPGTTLSLVVLRNVDLHNERPRGGEEKSLDLALWLSNFSHDFMGDIVFGSSLGLMQSSDGDGIRNVIGGNVKALGILGQIPWVTSLFHKMPGEQGPTKRDLFHYITNEDGLEKVKTPQYQSMNDILAAVVAGADTASTVLSGLFFHLLPNPSTFDRLKVEVDSEFPVTEGEPFDVVRLARMSAKLPSRLKNEALRLQPPVPTMLQRSPFKSRGGKPVAGRFVPESTAVYVPPWDEELQDFMAMNVGKLPIALNPRQ
ncbi:hypothetical protein ACEPAI_2801 [Sanghuangporus weigelae]